MASILEFIFDTVLLLIELAIDIFINTTYFFIPKPKKSVKDDVILITGAASGLGRLQAYKFAELGAKLIVCWDLNEAENDKTVNTINKQGGKAISFKCNLADKDQVYATVDLTKKAIKKVLNDNNAYVSMLINNAGVVTGKKMTECKDSLMQLTMDVNATAHFWTTKSFYPDMVAHNKGHIVTIASGAGLAGVTGLVDYCASKFAAVGFTESLYMEIQQSKKNINVTVLCPTFISTGMFEGAKSKYEWLIPILKPEYVVDELVTAILRNQYMVILPKILNLALALKPVLSMRLYTSLMMKLGVNSAMDDFVQTRNNG